MASSRRTNFPESEEGIATIKALKNMTEDSRFNTESSYSANTKLHPNHQVSFIEKHMAYLDTHPSLNPDQYVSNLRLMTRVR